MPASTLRFRAARAVRRLFRIDRERRWNTEYTAGDWSRLRLLDELAGISRFTLFTKGVSADNSEWTHGIWLVRREGL